MAYGVRLHVWGDRACFTRAEMKVERVSYDVPTPSACRGILEAILWKPQIAWTVDRIHVLRPIRFQGVRRNEVSAVAGVAAARSAMRSGDTAGMGIRVEDVRQQRATMHLVDVAYVIEARFALTDKAGPDDTEAKYAAMFERRASAGQCYHRPCLGVREFPAEFRFLRPEAPLPRSTLPPPDRDRDLGWMLHDIDFGTGASRFFRARLTRGCVDVRRCLAEGTAS